MDEETTVLDLYLVTNVLNQHEYPRVLSSWGLKTFAQTLLEEQTDEVKETINNLDEAWRFLEQNHWTVDPHKVLFSKQEIVDATL